MALPFITVPGLEYPFLSKLRITFAIIILLSLFTSITLLAQEKHSVQVKTFDQNLQTLKNVELSLNDRPYFRVGSRGVALIDLDADELPVKSIKIKDDKLEAASWNFSKGVLEIIIRPKNYTLIHFALRYDDGTLVPPTSVSFKGSKTITITTDLSGEFDLPLPLNEKVSSPDQFQVPDLQVVKLSLSDQENLIIVGRPNVVEEKKPEEPISKRVQFDVSRLDSIHSLAMFYSMFKNIHIADLDEETRRQIDAKFAQLMAQHKADSISRNEKNFISNITDTTFVIEDIRNLLNQAAVESEALQANRIEFESKIKVIANKLDKGVTNMDKAERGSLLSDLDRLEQLLVENENKFYQNQNDYHDIINSIRDKFVDIERLESRLSATEKQRLEEQKLFRQRLFLIGGVLIVFIVLIILLISFSSRLRKQAKDLQAANHEVKTINENLEAIVVNRTRLLEESNKELDTFLYRASHDLRAPVGSILGLCNIWEHIPQVEYVSKVQLTTQTMDQMIRKLITISEISLEVLNEMTINLSTTIKDVTDKNAKLIEQSRIQFHVDCPNDIIMHTSPSLISSILFNLIDNAVFFSSLKDPKHARVEVTAVMNHKNVELSVYDNGVGIENHMIPKLFDMFFMGHERAKGNGLGLYTVQKCVNALGGKITVESELTRYSKFKVILPLTRGVAPVKT